ncbi:MAG: hypothetical protein O3A77_03880 [bacterium]|nr:hypothetical protein [bacterium]
MDTKKQESKLNKEQQELLNRFHDHLAHVWEAYHVVNDIHEIAEQANVKQQTHLKWFARIFLRYLVVTVLHFFDDAGSDPDKQNLSIRFLKDNLKGCIFGAVAKDAFVQQQEKDNEETANASRESLKDLRNKYLAHNSVSRDDEMMKMTDKDAKKHIKTLLDYCHRFYEKIDPTMGSLETAGGRRCFVQQLLNNGLQLSKYPKLSLAIRYPNEKLLKKLNSVAEDWTNN